MEKIIQQTVKQAIQEATNKYDVEREFKIYHRRVTNPRKYTFKAIGQDPDIFPTPVSKQNVQKIYKSIVTKLDQKRSTASDGIGASFNDAEEGVTNE